MFRDNFGFLTKESGITLLFYLRGDVLEAHVVLVIVVNVVPMVLWGPKCKFSTLGISRWYVYGLVFDIVLKSLGILLLLLLIGLCLREFYLLTGTLLIKFRGD